MNENIINQNVRKIYSISEIQGGLKFFLLPKNVEWRNELNELNDYYWTVIPVFYDWFNGRFSQFFDYCANKKMKEHFATGYMEIGVEKWEPALKFWPDREKIMTHEAVVNIAETLKVFHENRGVKTPDLSYLFR